MIDLADALMPHLISVPILLPLVAACVLMLLSERRHRIKATFGLLATTANLAVAVLLAGLSRSAWPLTLWLLLPIWLPTGCVSTTAEQNTGKLGMRILVIGKLDIVSIWQTTKMANQSL